MKNVLRCRELPVFVLTLCIGFLIAVWEPAFLSAENLMDMLKSNSVLFISSLGMLLVVITGGIDVSTGSAVAVNTMLGGYVLVHYSSSIIVLFAVSLLTGIAIGLVNGFLIVQYKIPSIVVTLGILSVLFGVLLYFSNGNWITGFPENFIEFGKYRFFDKISGLPIQFILVLFSLALTFLVLRYTVLGRSIYALGGNMRNAAQFGVDTSKVLLFVYILHGMLQGIAAFTHSSIFSQADPNAFIGFELNVIAVVVIGGVHINGGKSSVLNIIVGTLFIGVMNNGLILSRVPTFWQKILLGAVIIASVTLDQIQSSRTEKNAPKIDVEIDIKAPCP